MSDPHKLTSQEQIKESSQNIKDEIQATNPKFKRGIKNQKPLTSKGKRFFRNVGVILLLIFLFPVGLIVMFRKSGWSKKSKVISSSIGGAFIALMAIAYVNAPPTATLDNIKLDGNQSVKSESFNIIGSVYPTDSTMTVNGQAAKIDSQGKFNYSVSLSEGDNDITISTIKGDKQSTSVYKIHRYTKSEVIAQEKAAAKKKADAAAAFAKKKADDVAAAQARQRQADEAKAKAAAAAAATAAKAKADADAAAKEKAAAAAAAAVTVSQKNALSKAKSYLSYTAFSHDGLVDQLVYEQFSFADATYGADNVGANWNEQAAKKAKSYMSYSSFSRGGLISQLEYEKFTPEQAEYGANAVGL
ncbi:MAG: hypothetical protein JWN33_19 [Candidatus Saccharibacteria bacterium]|nr:hypothetical protein [Candidatus Saccharibacteria bacterium]